MIPENPTPEEEEEAPGEEEEAPAEEDEEDEEAISVRIAASLLATATAATLAI